jgi:hypothetical protein
MIEVVDINAALQGLKVLGDWVQTHREMKNFNELTAAVAKVNSELSATYTALLTCQQEQLTLTKRVGELEKENMELKDWNRKRERYQRTEIAPRVFAYDLKPGMEQGETAHHLCANCFEKGEESTLQADAVDTKVYTYCCSRCQSKFPVASRSINTPVKRV